MVRYRDFIGFRADPIVSRCIERLASKWGIKKRLKGKGKGYKSETIRMAIVYAYLVDIFGVDPKEAPDKALEYLLREI